MKKNAIAVDHIAIRTNDLEEALEFYGEKLGLEITDQEKYESGETPYVAVQAGGTQIHIVPTENDIDSDEEHICLVYRGETTDAEEEIRELKNDLEEMDVEIESDEPRLRYGSIGRSWALYIRDPDNRRVELKIH